LKLCPFIRWKTRRFKDLVGLGNQLVELRHCCCLIQVALRLKSFCEAPVPGGNARALDPEFSHLLLSDSHLLQTGGKLAAKLLLLGRAKTAFHY